jgi:hypothetical protein
MLKEYGLLFPRAIAAPFRQQVVELLQDEHPLTAVIEALLSIHERGHKNRPNSMKRFVIGRTPTKL